MQAVDEYGRIDITKILTHYNPDIDDDECYDTQFPFVDEVRGV